MSNYVGADYGYNQEMIHFNMADGRDWGLWSYNTGNLSWQSSSNTKNFEVATTVNAADPAISITTTSGTNIAGAQYLSARNVYPFVNGEGNIGSDGLRWNTIYSVNDLDWTSDKRMKKDIEDVTLGLDFVMKIKPKKYRWKGDKTKGKKKYGIVAQDIAEALADCGCEDYDGLTLHPATHGNADTKTEDEELIPPMDEHYSMSTMPLVSTLIKAVQEQQTTITSLEADLANTQSTWVDVLGRLVDLEAKGLKNK
jgi:hypothetical protein